VIGVLHGKRVNPDQSCPVEQEYDVNCKHPTKKDHAQPRFDILSEACVMSGNYFFAHEATTSNSVPAMNYPASEFYDGEAKFHTIVNENVIQSEYMDIRLRSEPIPVN